MMGRVMESVGFEFAKKNTDVYPSFFVKKRHFKFHLIKF